MRLLFLLATLPLFGTVTVTSINALQVDYRSVRIVAAVAPTTSWMNVNWGLTTGYGFQSWNCLTGSVNGQGTSCAVTMGGLTPGTTYHYQVCGRPNQTNTTSQVCSGDATFTTLANPPYPSFPAAPTVVLGPSVMATDYLSAPGYTPILMTCSGSEAVAASSVGPITYGGGSWSVTAGDTVQQIINEVGYGGVIIFPQMAMCKVPDTGSNNGGYSFVCKVPDPSSSGHTDPAHRFIVFTTARSAATDFPPAGFRENPSNSTNNALLQAQIPASAGGGTGQIFQETLQSGCAGGQYVGHYLAYNLSWGVNATGSYGASSTSQTIASSGTLTFTVPAGLKWLTGKPIMIYQGASANTTTNMSATLSTYSGTTAVVSVGGSTGSGTYTSWTLAQYFAPYLSLGNNGDGFDIANPPEYMAFYNIYAPSCTQPCEQYGFMGGSPTNYFMDASYLVGYDWLQGFHAAFDVTSTGGLGGYYIDNNEIDSYSQGFFVESNSGDACGSNDYCPRYDNGTFTRNAMYWPASVFHGSGSWDGIQRLFRQQVEVKGGSFLNITGNYISGSYAYQNVGMAIYLSGTDNTCIQVGCLTGTQDAAITSNIITRAGAGFFCSGQRQGNVGPQNALMARILINNNLMWSVGLGSWTDAGASGTGLVSPAISISGCQDTNAIGNSFGYVNGDSGNLGLQYIPVINYTVPVDTALNGAFSYTGNYDFYSLGQYPGVAGVVGSPCCSPVASSPVGPLSSAPATALQVLQGSSVQIGSSATYLGNWQYNLHVGGTIWNVSEPWPSATDSQITTANAGMPTGDIYPNSNLSGSPVNTMAQRIVNSGVPGINSGDARCAATTQNPCSYGANVQDLESAHGIVSNIAWVTGPAAAQFSFIAADSVRPVSIDLVNGATKIRCTVGVSASGCASTGVGTRNQTITFTGLSNATTYGVVVMDYFSQSSTNAPWFSFPSDPSNLVTDGFTVTTTASGTRTLPFSYALQSGEASRVVTCTPIGASALSPQTFTGGSGSYPSVPNGSYSCSILVKNSGGATISGPSIVSGT